MRLLIQSVEYAAFTGMSNGKRNVFVQATKMQLTENPDRNLYILPYLPPVGSLSYDKTGPAFTIPLKMNMPGIETIEFNKHPPA